MARILLVDDEVSILSVLEIYLRKAGYETVSATSAAEALALYEPSATDLMIVDLRLGEGMDGLELMHACRARKSHLPVIMITAYGTIEVAVQAMKEGAYDFITKPFEFKELLSTVEGALEEHRNVDGEAHSAAGGGGEGPTLHFGTLIGESAQMQVIYNIINRVAPSDATVLIQGESGTGKELVARAIHKASKRDEGPWVPLNCAALPATLLESEMFGHAAGAFTGAVGRRDGLFMTAHNGTLFLDEIGVMDKGLQGKLLRALQEGKVRRVGENKDEDVNVRVLAATNEALEERMKSGEFREDLFYRLSVIPLEVPPLRHRKPDIPLLVNYFCGRQALSLGRDIACDEEAMAALSSYAWPGNVRELQNAIACAATLSDNGRIKTQDLPPNIVSDSLTPELLGQRGEIDLGKSLRDFLKEKERQYMEAVLAHTDGNRARAADLLGISRATFYRKFPEVAGEHAEH